MSGTAPHDGSAAVPRWLDRTARLLGVAGLARLRAARVAVFGLGGVGSYAVEGLARSGIGHLTLVDFDDVSITNLNRQMHALHGTVGQAKSDLMAARVRAIDPAIDVQGIKAFYDRSQSEFLLTPPPDYVVDCIDNVTAKLHLLATCLQKRIPVVTSLGASAKVDPTLVRTGPLAETYADPLARAIRKNLRRKYGIEVDDHPELAAVFSTEPYILPDAAHCGAPGGDARASPDGESDRHSGRSRRIVHGSAVFVTSVFGMAAAGVVVRGLAGPIPVERRPQGAVCTPPAPHMRRKRRTPRDAATVPGRVSSASDG